MSQIFNDQKPDSEEHVEVDRAGGVEHQVSVIRNRAAEQRSAAYRLSQIIYLLFGILEGLIAIRFVLKLIAANPANPFASLIYNFTDLFLWPFFGITGTPAVGGSVLEISSIFGLIVYALLSWVVVKIVWLLLYHPTTRVVRTYDRDYDDPNLPR